MCRCCLNDFIFDSISFESFDPGQRRIVCEKRQRHQFDLRHGDGRTRATAVSAHGRHARQQDAALLYVASQRTGNIVIYSLFLIDHHHQKKGKKM